MTFQFLYHDQPASQHTIDSYIVGEYIHENGQVAASTLRGGLLTDCNLRYLFITNIGGGFQTVNEDYKRQGLFLFDLNMTYDIYDNYRVGEYAQVLLSPDANLTDELMEEVIKAARIDFNQLLHTPPVPVLDTQDWRKRLDHPLGTQGQRPHYKLRES